MDDQRRAIALEFDVLEKPGAVERAYRLCAVLLVDLIADGKRQISEDRADLEVEGLRDPGDGVSWQQLPKRTPPGRVRDEFDAG